MRKAAPKKAAKKAAPKKAAKKAAPKKAAPMKKIKVDYQAWHDDIMVPALDSK